MGTKYSAFFGLAEEVSTRCCIMRSGIKQYSRILSNPRIPVKSKITIIRMYLLTKGVFQCSTWPILNTAHLRKFHSTILYMYRKATNNCFQVSDPNGDMFSDADIVKEFSLVSPSAMLRQARLQLLTRILDKSPTAIVSLIHASYDNTSGWLHAIKSDLTIVSPRFADFTPGDVKSSIESIIKYGPRRYTKAFKKHLSSPFANLEMPEYAHNIKCTPAPNINTYPCQQCDSILTTYQKLCLRQFKRHGTKNPIRLLFEGQHCPICMGFFHTRTRVYNHILRRSPICRNTLILHGNVISQERSDQLDLEERPLHTQLSNSGMRYHTAVDRAFRIPGPIALPMYCSAYSSHHPLGRGRNYYAPA